MDLDPVEINKCLMEVGLPSSVADLKNPTEKYVLELCTQFLNTMDIDFNAVKRPTLDQLNSFSYPDDNMNIIKLINLSEVMANICHQIFLKDFFLTDLTSPAPKKTRRIARILSNFLIYALNKNLIIEQKLEVMKQKRQELEILKAETAKYIEHKNEMVFQNSKKMELREHYEAEIEKIKIRRNQKKARLAEVEKDLIDVDKAKLSIVQQHGDLKTESLRVRKINEELESKLVTSPEKYKARLKELIELKETQSQKRVVIQEAVISKKSAIERIKTILSIVSNAQAKFPETSETSKRLLESKKQLEEARKKLDEMNNLLHEESKVPSDMSQGSNAMLQKAKDQCENYLAPIRNQLTELLNQKKILQHKFADDQNRQREIYSQRDEIRSSIHKVETNYEEFITGCQELYNKEINTERRMKMLLEADHHLNTQ